MSIFKEISESHSFVKVLAISLILAPFWYLALYLFNYDFFKTEDIILKTVFCTSISVASSLALGNLSARYNRYAKDKKEIAFEVFVLVAIYINCIYLSLMLFVGYSIQYFTEYSIIFYWFLFIYLLPIILGTLLLVLAGLFGQLPKNEEAAN
jgi:hypothetical protein